MTSFAAAQHKTTTEQTEAILIFSNISYLLKIISNKADVCEAFWCVLCVLWFLKLKN